MPKKPTLSKQSSEESTTRAGRLAGKKWVADKKAGGEAGISKITALVFILFTGAFLYFGFQIFGHLYNHEELRGLIEFQIREADQRTDDEIRRMIENEMRKLDINADYDDLEIDSGHQRLDISLYYEEDVYLYINDDYNWTLHTFEFDIQESGEASAHRQKSR